MVHTSPNPRPINYDISNLLFTVDSSGAKKLSYTINYNFIVPQDQMGSSFYLVTTIPSLSQDWNNRFYPSYPSGSYDVSLNFTNKQPTNDVSGSIAVYNMDSSKVMKKYLSPTFNFSASLKSQISEKPSKPDSVFSSSEPTQSIIDIIPSIPEAQAVTTSDGITYGVALGNHKEQAIIESQSVPPLPTFLSISGITDKSVSITWDRWDSSRYIDFKIINWHYTLKNLDNDQTIKQQTINKQQSGISETSLTSNTNYKVYLIAINAFGNSDEQHIDFKTLGVTSTTPQVSDMGVIIPATPTTPTYNFIIESDGKVRVIRITGNAGEEIRISPSMAKTNVELGHVRLLTAQERAGTVIFIDELKPDIEPLPPQLETESCQQYRTRVSNLGFSYEWLSPCPETIPALPNSNSYEMKLTSASYMGTSKGKTVNIQTSINLTGVATNSIHARIEILNSAGIRIYQNFQNLSVGGGQTFPLVFNIPDLGKEEEGISGGEATSIINYKIYLWESVDNPTALLPFPFTGQLTYDSEVIRPDPITGEVKDTNSLLGKVMGITALIGTLALLGSKRR